MTRAHWRRPRRQGSRSTATTSPLAKVFWDSAQKVRWRFDAVNQRLGDTGTQVVITNADGSETMEMLRLKVANGAITEMEILRCNKGDIASQLVGAGTAGQGAFRST